MYKQDFTLNKLLWVSGHETKRNQTIDGTRIGNTILGQYRRRINGKERVFHNMQRSRTETSPSDADYCLIRGFYPDMGTSAEM